jgi:hypothetical protein
MNNVLPMTPTATLQTDIQRELRTLSRDMRTLIERYGPDGVMPAFGRRADRILAMVRDGREEALVLDRLDTIVCRHGLAVD